MRLIPKKQHTIDKENYRYMDTCKSLLATLSRENQLHYDKSTQIDKFYDFIAEIDRGTHFEIEGERCSISSIDMKELVVKFTSVSGKEIFFDAKRNKSETFEVDEDFNKAYMDAVYCNR